MINKLPTRKFEPDYIKKDKEISLPKKEEFVMPNHNKLILKYCISLLKGARTKSVYYETPKGIDEKELEQIQKLEIVTNKKTIKAEY